MKKKIFISFVLLSLLVNLTGCQVHPNEVVKSFLELIKEKKINQAGNFCTVELRNSLRNFPYAFNSYKYAIKKIEFDFKDLQKTKDGLVAFVKVRVIRFEPPPSECQGLMSIFLKKFDNKWFINSIDINTENIEYNKKQVRGVKARIINARPIWITVQEFSGSVSNFIFKYDNYCKKWEQ